MLVSLFLFIYLQHSLLPVGASQRDIYIQYHQ